jgi:hypothetical protein
VSASVLPEVAEYETVPPTLTEEPVAAGVCAEQVGATFFVIVQVLESEVFPSEAVTTKVFAAGAAVNCEEAKVYNEFVAPPMPLPFNDQLTAQLESFTVAMKELVEDPAAPIL